MSTATAAALERARELAGAVPDPELPMITIGQLGILRGVRLAGEQLVVTITPTYSGCPALAAIEADLRRALAGAGFADVRVETVLAPAWSTDDITPEGRRALAEAGVSPPDPVRGAAEVPLGVRCPQCGSLETVEFSRFGSTACTSLWRCRSCGEPFSRVKPF